MGHEPELISDTLAENIRLGKPGEIDSFLRTVCLNEEVRQMPQGVNTSVGSGGVRLSGGQQARVALARTLYNSRSVLILDDPFSAVDRGTEQNILKNLRALAKNKIVILFSHRLYQFPTFDRVLFICDGKGVFSTHEELMQENSDYAKLYLEQVNGGSKHET
jgi:ATP-binding cassette subfamily B protein